MRKLKEQPLIVDVDELDPHFSNEIVKRHGGKEILACFQCGTCVASCPVRAIEDRYNLRRIMKMASLGMKDQILGNPFIWICSTCLLCNERCPQDVNPQDVMNVIKNMAVEEGKIPEKLKKIIDEIQKNGGRLYPIDEFIEVERKELGLPKIATELEEVRKLISGV